MSVFYLFALEFFGVEGGSANERCSSLSFSACMIYC